MNLIVQVIVYSHGRVIGVFRTTAWPIFESTGLVKFQRRENDRWIQFNTVNCVVTSEQVHVEDVIPGGKLGWLGLEE
jgi:hypothetical protein